MNSAALKETEVVYLTTLQIRFLQLLLDGPLVPVDLAKGLSRSSSQIHAIAETLISRGMIRKVKLDRPHVGAGARVCYEIVSLSFKFDNAIVELHLGKL